MISTASKLCSLVPVVCSFLSADAYSVPSRPSTSWKADKSIGRQLLQLKQPFYPSNADCVDYMIPVDLSFDNPVFNATKFANEFDLINFVTVATSRAGAGGPSPL